MNVVHIPDSQVISENGKEYTVYRMLITIQGRTHEVHKRFRELYEMHRILKKQVNVPSFPPKLVRNRNFKTSAPGATQTIPTLVVAMEVGLLLEMTSITLKLAKITSKVIEARKVGLQHYFQSIVSTEPHCGMLLDLLKIPIISHSNLNETQSFDSFDSDEKEISHRPVIYFKPEVTESSYISKARDNIVPGVFIALYD